MNKNILLIGYNFYPEPTGIGKYSGEMMSWLADNGYACHILTAYPYYPFWKVSADYYNNRFSYKSEVIASKQGHPLFVHRCPMYIPAKPSGLKRILLDFSFLISAFLRLLPLIATHKFHTVIAVAPSFQFGLLGIISKKILKANLVYHIQDLQIEAARDLNMIKSKPVVEFLFKVERYIFKNANYITSISDDMVKKIQEKAKKTVILFPNWADNSTFYPITNKAGLKEKFNFQAEDRIVLYSGAIGEKQGLEYILEAARNFKSQQHIKFVICGTGPYKEQLQARSESLGLQNVLYFPLQPLEKFNEFLNMADAHLVIQKGKASDLVMPSKLTTILAVGGLAIVTANAGSGLHSLVSKHQMGILVHAEDQQALNAGIQQAISGATHHLTANALAYANKYLSIETVMRAFENNVLGGQQVAEAALSEKSS